MDKPPRKTDLFCPTFLSWLTFCGNSLARRVSTCHPTMTCLRLCHCILIVLDVVYCSTTLGQSFELKNSTILLLCCFFAYKNQLFGCPHHTTLSLIYLKILRPVDEVARSSYFDLTIKLNNQFLLGLSRGAKDLSVSFDTFVRTQCLPWIVREFDGGPTIGFSHFANE